jgi:hypothetical protein
LQDLLRVITAGDEKAGAEEGNDLFEGSEDEEEEVGQNSNRLRAICCLIRQIYLQELARTVYTP